MPCASTIKFKNFVEWMLSVFIKCVQDSTTEVLNEHQKVLDETRKESVDTKKELGNVKADKLIRKQRGCKDSRCRLRYMLIGENSLSS